MSEDKLREEIEELEDEINDIQAKLDIREADALASGKPVDFVWRAKARAALRYRKSDLMRAQGELAAAKKAANAQTNFVHQFYFQARKLLTAEQVAGIEALVSESIANGNKL